MPAFMEPQVVFRGPSFPPQYLEPKYEGSMDHPVGFHIHVAPTTDSDYLHPDPYNHSRHPTGPAPAYNGYGAFYNDSAAVPHHMGAPMIQPLQIDNRYVSHRNGYESRQHSNHVVQTQVPQDEKVVGGVSAQLDYDMAQMTDFVVEMSVAVIQPDTYDEVLFRKWVLQVLNATRLPSATIVLSLSYLSLRVRGLASSNLHLPTERGLYQMLTVALILGSKFLDDNTFQNKSWAEVSNISVAELNLDEMHWLAAFKHRLHHDPAVADGFNCWEAKWTAFKSRPTISTTLHPLDTSQRRHVNGRQSTSPARYAHQYPIQAMSAISLESSGNPPAYTPSFPAYDAWYGRRSSDRSPSTASHTGPNTPEYYDNRRWGPSQARPGRDEQYTLGDAANMTPGTVAFRPSYDPPAYAVKQSIWNCHGHACQCANCRNAQPFQPRFGPVIAA